MVDPHRLAETTATLVRIDSTNPTLAAGGAGEAAVAEVVAAMMTEIGLDVERWDAAPGRPNVVGVLRGTGGGRSLMLNAHLDTVGVEGMAAPFAAEIRDGRLYGRGAQDMKASLAAQLEAARVLQASGLPLAGDLVIAAVADEEDRSLGTEALLTRYRTDGAMVTEPTDLRLTLAHKGFAWIDVTTHGRAAHGSRPEEGVDANLHMGRILAGLDTLRAELATRPPHPLVGTASLHAAQLQGGTAPSVYAATCRLRIERRLIPGEHPADALAEIETLLRALHTADPTFRADAHLAFARAPLETPPTSPLAQTVRTATQAVLGTPSPDAGASFWTDAALLAKADIDTVLLGPTGAGLHTTEEWVDLASVAHLTAILVETARLYCG
ncbi:MAG: M20/M25/M40 family metallo-hydrolase [Bacteroidota bacterium]